MNELEAKVLDEAYSELVSELATELVSEVRRKTELGAELK